MVLSVFKVFYVKIMKVQLLVDNGSDSNIQFNEPPVRPVGAELFRADRRIDEAST